MRRKPIILRRDQVAAIEAILSAYDRGCHRQLVSAATGYGKTVVISAVIPLLRDRVAAVDPNRWQIFLLAHREELCDQLASACKRENPELSIGIERANETADPSCDVIVASIPTIGRKNSSRIKKFDPNKTSVIVTDEAHHAASQTYINVQEYFGVNQSFCHAVSLGFTATPKRHDNVGLNVAYDEIVFHKPMMDLIEEGNLCRMKCFKVSTDVSLDDVKQTRGDFSIGSLAETVNTPERNRLIIDAWNRLAWGRKSTLVFAANVRHAYDLQEAFVEAGFEAETVVGSTNSSDRSNAFDKFRNRELPFLVNVGVATEGVDVPNIDCVILARPTRSPLLLTQMIGRGMRVYENKEDCVFLDIVDTLRRGSLMTIPSLMGLPVEFDVKGKDVSRTIKEVDKAAASSIGALKALSVEEAQQAAEIAGSAFNPFEMKYDPSVKKYTKFEWRSAGSDHWAIDLAGKGYCEIVLNALFQYEIYEHRKDGTIKSVGMHREAGKAFKAADEHLSNVLDKGTRNLIDSKANWRSDGASAKQLEKLKAWRIPHDPATITKGQASRLMDEQLEKWRSKKPRISSSQAKIVSEFLDVKTGKI
jgi:ATP-dependent helicase IRC3